MSSGQDQYSKRETLNKDVAVMTHEPDTIFFQISHNIW